MMLYFLLLKAPFPSFSESRFRPSPSPVSVLSESSVPLKVLSHPPQSSVPVLLRVPCPSSPSSSIISKSSPLLPDSRARPLRPLPSSQSPLPSSPIPVPVLSTLFLPLKVLSPPLSPSQKQRNDTKPSRRSWWLVVVGSKTEHSSPPRSLLGTVQTREPRWWRSRLRPRQKWRRLPHWCQG